MSSGPIIGQVDWFFSQDCRSKRTSTSNSTTPSIEGLPDRADRYLDPVRRSSGEPKNWIQAAVTSLMILQLVASTPAPAPAVASLRHFNCMPLGTFRCRQARSAGTRHPTGSVGRASMVRKTPGGLFSSSADQQEQPFAGQCESQPMDQVVTGSNWHRLANNADEFPDENLKNRLIGCLVLQRAVPRAPETLTGGGCTHPPAHCCYPLVVRIRATDPALCLGPVPWHCARVNIRSGG